jgi:hypothetical protein
MRNGTSKVVQADRLPDLRFVERHRQGSNPRPRIRRGNDGVPTSLSRRQRSGFEEILARHLTLFDASSHHV